ncbi:ATP-binding protein [Alteromonas sp.]|nr:ATP-binding protein [Alteromonas sp.]
MSNAQQPLRKLLMKGMLPRLSALVLIIVTLTLLLTFYFMRSEANRLQQQSLDSLKQNLSFVIDDTAQQLSNLAANDIIINSLVDVEQRANYLPMFFRSLQLTHAKNVSFALYDFAGDLIIEKNWNVQLPPQLQNAWQQRTLGSSKAFVSLTSDGVLLTVPVLMQGVAEGALVMYVDSLQALLDGYPSLTNQVVTDRDGTVLFSSDTSFITPNSILQNYDTRGYRFKSTMWQSLTIYSVKPLAMVYQDMYWIITLILVMTVGMIIINIQMIMKTTLLVERTLSRLYNDIKHKTLNESEPNVFKEEEEARELIVIKQAFDELVVKLSDMSLSNEQFSDIIDSMGDKLFVIDKHRNKLLENRSFEQFLNEAKTHSNDVAEQLLEAGAEQEAKELSYYSVSDAESRIIRWSASALKNSAHEVKGTIFVGTDVTAQRSLESHVKVLTHAIEKAEVSIVISDITRVGQPIIYVNRAFTALTGYEKDEIIGSNCRFMQGDNTGQDDIAQLRQAIAERKPIETTLLNYRKDGSAFYNHLILTPVSTNDTVTHYIGFQQDVTKKRKAEQFLEETKQRAEESARLKSSFLAGMSHEIRTPIHGVSGVLQLLGKTKLNDDQKHYLSLATFSVESLLHIVNDILDFSKIEAGQLHIENTVFNLSKELETLKSQYVISCQEKGLQLSFNTSLEGFDRAIGDAIRFRQIMSNLIGNAVKFTDSGRIGVDISIREISKHALKLQGEITDTGIGIAKEKLPGIFDVFTQEDHSTTRQYGGTGLGLSISKQLCELMGGNITVESEKGRGSKFVFSIILRVIDSEMKTNEQAIAPATTSLTTKKQKILVVEDNEINQVIVKEQLRNHDTHSAMSGQEAIDILRSEEATFDLILMDCQMPIMDGFEATQRIRDGQAGERYNNVPIIALTANAMKGDREQCFNAGMNDYLGKPFDIDDLLDKVEYWACKRGDDIVY